MFWLRRTYVVLLTAAFIATLALTPAAMAQEKKTEKEEPKAEKKEPKAEKKLMVGDPAPQLKVEKFLKGDPVEKFKKGQIYVVEFWATWCPPCRATMPHFTELQKKFKDKATFISVNVWEDKEYTDKTIEKVQEFIKGNDENMGYTIAFDGAKKETDLAYMKAAGRDGIPCAFIVTGDAKIAYIGHPVDEEFEQTIQQLIDGKFDMEAAMAAAKKRQAEEEVLEKNRAEIMKLNKEIQQLVKDEKTDEALAKLDELAKLLPKQMVVGVDMQKFTILLKSKTPEKAYEIAQKLIDGPAKDNAQMLNAIAWGIVDPEAKVEEPNVTLAMKAAELAVKLTKEKDPAIMDTLARCYWVKGEQDKAKAIEIQNNAVELAKDNEAMQSSLKETLKEYKNEKKGEVAKGDDKGKKAKGKKGEEADEEEEEEENGEEDEDD